MKCERCGRKTGDLLDYCAKCSKNLCPLCMVMGCCGKVPAESGQEQDHPDEDKAPE